MSDNYASFMPASERDWEWALSQTSVHDWDFELPATPRQEQAEDAVASASQDIENESEPDDVLANTPQLAGPQAEVHPVQANNGIPSIHDIRPTFTQGRVSARLVGIPDDDSFLDPNVQTRPGEDRDSNPNKKQVSSDKQDLERFLNASFNETPDPPYEDKERWAKRWELHLRDVDTWFINKRKSLNMALPAIQVNHQPAHQEPHYTPRTTSSRSYPQESTDLSPVQNRDQDAESEYSQSTAPSTHSQDSALRWKCTFPGCKRVTGCGSASAQARHEHEVHWPVDWFPCLLCSISRTEDSSFHCIFCQEEFKELVDVESHILNLCDRMAVCQESARKIPDVEEHHRRWHPDTWLQQLLNDEEGVVWNCRFCLKKFGQEDNLDAHACRKKTAWQPRHDLKRLFLSMNGPDISFEGVLHRWHFRMEDGFPVPWPKKCSVPSCEMTFDNLYNRAKHFDQVHYILSSAAMTRGFSDSGSVEIGQHLQVNADVHLRTLPEAMFCLKLAICSNLRSWMLEPRRWI
ncbi:hypothetical protein B0O99DRAFT_28201 [Bisporella sp. PMI_857]|nr:hypothetical protein B0O99DRAFT_28201 [Bisporella sp. PMI_857]